MMDLDSQLDTFSKSCTNCVFDYVLFVWFFLLQIVIICEAWGPLGPCKQRFGRSPVPTASQWCCPWAKSRYACWSSPPPPCNVVMGACSSACCQVSTPSLGWWGLIIHPNHDIDTFGLVAKVMASAPQFLQPRWGQLSGTDLPFWLWSGVDC